eukprot:CAMPEP_0184336262 /NCGR_PEP_ID=MMETSP1089-20130417/4623_1 /TAXON_ID=38269 ORGANISM="Gloeochaete wittrockiana, Strain SAG46.84" /NCGR_SAMPLE_ID=MMETSP1089 /ASSEMBLY_ACC=CAM_ASM_000445 /LENGTH=160 /DNA_ID=CAMNT_0026661237 /DNA_START=291 /DNA_END=773 /DNA_ORIENTATION=-
MLKVKRSYSQMCDSEDELFQRPGPPSPSSSSSSSAALRQSDSFAITAPAAKRFRSSMQDSAEELLFKTAAPKQTSTQIIEKYIETTARRNSQRPKPNQLFTIDDVKEIVAKALREREDELTSDYDRILNERLQEQFNSFSRFNQDYISNHLRKSEYDYMS